MLKAVIFDLNGIFLQGELLSERLKRDFDLKPSEFLPVLIRIMEQVRKPDALDSYDLFKPYLKQWKIKLTKAAFFQYWFSGEHLNKEMLEYVHHLKLKKIKIYLLSNNFRERTEYYRKELPELFQVADRAYFSWETGAVKPDEKAYLNVLNEAGVKPEEAAYFDDSEKNVLAARKLGINADQFSGVKETKKIIEELRKKLTR